MYQAHPKSNRRRLWSCVALGVPWMLGVGVLVAAERAQNGGWLTRSLLNAWSSSTSLIATAQPEVRPATPAFGHHNPPRIWTFEIAGAARPQPATRAPAAEFAWVAPAIDAPAVEVNLHLEAQAVREAARAAAPQEREVRARVEQALAAVPFRELPDLSRLEQLRHLRDSYERAESESCASIYRGVVVSVESPRGS